MKVQVYDGDGEDPSILKKRYTIYDTGAHFDDRYFEVLLCKHHEVLDNVSLTWECVSGGCGTKFNTLKEAQKRLKICKEKNPSMSIRKVR